MRDGAWHQRGDGCYLGLSARAEEHKALDCERSGGFFSEPCWFALTHPTSSLMGEAPLLFSFHFSSHSHFSFWSALCFCREEGRKAGRLLVWAGGKTFPPAFLLNLKVTHSLSWNPENNYNGAKTRQKWCGALGFSCSSGTCVELELRDSGKCLVGNLIRDLIVCLERANSGFYYCLYNGQNAASWGP